MSESGEVASSGSVSWMETKASSGWREARVEDGDAEAPRAEEPRELEHRGGVALGREGEQYGAAAGGRWEKFGILQCSKVGFGVLISRKLVPVDCHYQTVTGR